MKKVLISLIFSLVILTFPTQSLAQAGQPCSATSSTLGCICTSNRQCPVDSRCEKQASGRYLCTARGSSLDKVFGRIQPPAGADQLGIGSIGISKFLNNLITLIYTISTVAFVLLIIWSGFEWLTSGGDKEKVASAQKRLTYAFIGIGVEAIAFALINVFGTFTGFKFF